MERGVKGAVGLKGGMRLMNEWMNGREERSGLFMV